MSLKVCPICQAKARMTDSRPFTDWVRRRYLCANGHKYSTVETVVPKELAHQGRTTFKDRLLHKFRDEDPLRKRLLQLLEDQH